MALDQVQAFLSVAQGEGVLVCISLIILPAASFRVLPPLGFHVIAAHLAHIMQQGNNRHRFLLFFRKAAFPRILLVRQIADRNIPQAVVHIKAMDKQAAGVCPVVLRGGRGREKVCFLLQPVQHGVRIVPVDIVLKNVLEMGLRRLQSVHFQKIHCDTSTP